MPATRVFASGDTLYCQTQVDRNDAIGHATRMSQASEMWSIVAVVASLRVIAAVWVTYYQLPVRRHRKLRRLAEARSVHQSSAQA